MGHLLDGAWSFDDVLVESEGGLYVKKPSQFRNWITADGSSGYAAEAGRYVLYSSIACPWAHRTAIFRVLKKLDGLIQLVNTEQTSDDQGWAFVDGPHTVPGTDNQVNFLHEIYALGDPGCTTRVTVPALWDSRTRTVVSNESSEIVRMFNTEFGAIAEPTPDYYPEELRSDIDAMNDKVLKGINNAVNGSGRSTSQEAYEQSIDLLFGTLDEMDGLLSRQRYLCGDKQTEADWRFYPNLIRFDPIYYVGYKCNQRHLEDYPHLSNYLRDLYQMPGIHGVSDVTSMKRQTFDPAGPIGANGVVPRGPVVDLTRPHDRDRFDKAA
ncbi:MAG: glutathione S-transferase family protein [Rhodospirillaceae bacterium]|jgi:putative glutathione S-transferase|nr:glutathione S-transferase family protein [Rhodospirillaceae bacterium]MBT5455603.1 glutathione S-transferase family protein [Rhodospirillaceae bacterium]